MINIWSHSVVIKFLCLNILRKNILRRLIIEENIRQSDNECKTILRLLQSQHGWEIDRIIYSDLEGLSKQMLRAWCQQALVGRQKI